MEGKIVVADFFFTHCPTICPTLTRNMRDLQRSIKSSAKIGNRDADFVQFLSLTIDPERDSVAELKKWADRFQINPQNWWLLTGEKKQIYDLSLKEMRVPAEDGGLVDSNFAHTDVFVLIDKNRNIRGYYHTIITDTVNGGYTPDSASLAKLSKDIIFLALEKDPNKKFFLSGKLELIAIVFVIVAIGLVLLFKVLKREKK
jgi:protein SCO1/2